MDIENISEGFAEDVKLKGIEEVIKSYGGRITKYPGELEIFVKSPGNFTIFWEYDQPFYAVGFSYYFLYYSHQNYHGEKRFTYKTTDKMHQHAERLNGCFSKSYLK